MTRAFYNELFRDLFPAEWRAFMEGRFRERGQTLMEVFAENEAELIALTNDAPPVEQFIELMERHYFPLPEFWMDIDAEEEEMEHFMFQEIPISPFFESDELDDDAHHIWPVFQVLKTLKGDVKASKDCDDTCGLRLLFTLACNELHRVDLGRLHRLGKRESGPLRHLALACEIMDKQTGNIWFDMDYEMYGQTGVHWDVANVRSVKTQYHLALRDLDKLKELNAWFTKDMRRVREASTLWRKAAIL